MPLGEACLRLALKRHASADPDCRQSHGGVAIQVGRDLLTREGWRDRGHPRHIAYNQLASALAGVIYLRVKLNGQAIDRGPRNLIIT